MSHENSPKEINRKYEGCCCLGKPTLDATPNLACIVHSSEPYFARPGNDDTCLLRRSRLLYEPVDSKIYAFLALILDAIEVPFDRSDLRLPLARHVHVVLASHNRSGDQNPRASIHR